MRMLVGEMRFPGNLRDAATAPYAGCKCGLWSVMVNGQRYAIRTDANRIESQRDNSIVGNIIGAVTGGQGSRPGCPRSASRSRSLNVVPITRSMWNGAITA
jgi:hypothetical protein